MKSVFAAVAVLAALVTPAQAQSDLEVGFLGALKGCEAWVMNPASWAGGPAPFISAVGLGSKMSLVDRVDEAALPPPPLRRGNHFWRINATPGAGFVLVVSDALPMCHITGGGDADLQPVVASALASKAFSARWKPVKESATGDLATTVFQNVEEPKFSISISRAKVPGDRLDRVQVLATATLAMGR